MDSKLEPNVGLAYFYFDYDYRNKQTLDYVVASILKQILLYKDGLPLWITECKDLYRRFRLGWSVPGIEKLKAAIKQLCKDSLATYVVIDALDEADVEFCRKGMLVFLNMLFESRIRVLVTSREHSEDITRVLSNWPMHIAISAIDSDIINFSNHKIDNCSIREIIDDNLKQDIINLVVNKASGM